MKREKKKKGKAYCSARDEDLFYEYPCSNHPVSVPYTFDRILIRSVITPVWPGPVLNLVEKKKPDQGSY